MGETQLTVLRDQQLGERDGVCTGWAAVNSHDHMAEHRSHFRSDHGTVVGRPRVAV